MMKFIYTTALFFTFNVVALIAQTNHHTEDYLSLSWDYVASKMPAEWYSSAQALAVADNLLVAQKDVGGWPKNQPFHHEFTDEQKSDFYSGKSEIGATFDNGATITELRFLAKVFSHHKYHEYRKAIENGIEYILEAQYENGGWPQFFPSRRADEVTYSDHITYNDNAMVNIMYFLRDIIEDAKDLKELRLNPFVKRRVQQAYDLGIECILNTQIVDRGQPTVWCAQHDAVTLAPAKARSYELESFSGAESIRIIKFLMSIDQPSDRIVAAIDGAIQWLEDVKIEGVKVEKIRNKDGELDRFVFSDPNAKPLLARFYDLKTRKPFFCDRDGVKKHRLADIGYERRNGYSWYTSYPSELVSEWKNRP
ncbi:pectate lyase [Membranihabitans marinus]|uniref:pectate lyase n=1 Tax=Membranihabitans marinus TaxID=1227546 RepID=UPI001F0098A5|nr:pectate lyase [Membranihabitans marinus]